MRLAQKEGKGWNLLQCLRDREVRQKSGEPFDVRLLEGRTRDSSNVRSISSFVGAESVGDGRARGNKRHSSPVQPPSRGHIRQQGSRHHADRFRTTTQKGLEFWTVTPEEILADFGWQQANPHRMVNRRGELINPNMDEERRSDGVGSNTSSFEYERKALSRYSSDGGPLSPQISLTSPPAKTPSIKSPLRNVPSFAMSSASLTRSRSPSPVRGAAKHNRQTSDLLEIPTRVRKKIQDKIKGEKSGGSSRQHSPNRSDTMPPTSGITEVNLAKTTRSSTFPANMRLNIDALPLRPTVNRRRVSIFPYQESERRREHARTRARLASTGISARAILSKGTQITSVIRCQTLMGTIAGLNRSLTTSFEHDHSKAITDLTTTLSNLESRQTQLANRVQSALTKTRTETEVKIAEIAAEQTSTLLLQVKAIEDKMDALEYRTKSGWTHEKTLHLVFLVLEYIVMVILWHLWLLLSVLRLSKRVFWGVWIVVWGIINGIIHLIGWLFFMYP